MHNTNNTLSTPRVSFFLLTRQSDTVSRVKSRLMAYLLTVLFIPLVLFCSEVSMAEAWTVQDVTGNVFTFNQYPDHCIAVDSENNSYLIVGDRGDYYGDHIDDLYLCWLENGSWQHEQVPDILGKTEDFSILIDSNDTIHILHVAYDDSQGPYWIVHSYGRPGQWSLEYPIEQEQIRISYMSTTIDSNDKLHVSFSVYDYNTDSYTIYYLTNSSGTWQYEVVVEDAESAGSKIIVSPDNTIYVTTVTLDVFNNPQCECFSKQAGVWQEQKIPLPAGIPFMAVDSLGHLHAVMQNIASDFLSNDLLYATNASGSWVTDTIETITEPNFIYAGGGLVIDSNDQVHMTSLYTDLHGYLFGDSDMKASLHHFKGSYGSWQKEIIYTDDPDDRPKFSGGIAIDAQDKLYIPGSLEREQTLDMFSGTWGDWQQQTIAYSGQTGNRSILTLDSSNQPQIAYCDSYADKVKWAATNGVTWITDTNDIIDTTISDWDACLDNTDNRYIAYTDRDGGCHGYFCDTNGIWKNQSWDYKVYHPSIAAISPENIHIGMFDAYGVYDIRALWDKTNINSTWENLYLQDENQNGETSGFDVNQKMKADSTGMIHNVYVWNPKVYYGPYSFRHDTHLKYGKLVNGSWATEIIDPNITEDYAPQPDIAFGDIGNAAHISYFHENDYEIKYATNVSGSWVIESIPTNGLLSRYTAIAVDSSGLPHIAFIEDDMLKIARYTDSSCTQWETEIIGEEVGAYSMPSLEIDSNDEYHISFYKESESKILYATTAIDTPCISVEPETIDFYISKNSAGDTGLTIRNDGSATLNISSMTFTGPDADKFSHSGFSSSLPPGGICLTTVTLDTSHAGSFDAELRIQSDDPRNPTLTVPLHAFVFESPFSGLYHKIEYIDFGQIEVGHSSDTVAVRFSNSNDITAIMIKAILVTDTNFTIQGPTIPITLQPGEYFIVNVTFEPQTMGLLEGLLNVYTIYDPIIQQLAASVALAGEGIPVRVPDLTVTADNLSLEAILPDGYDRTYISIENTGDADLVIAKWDADNVTEFTHRS